MALQEGRGWQVQTVELSGRLLVQPAVNQPLGRLPRLDSDSAALECAPVPPTTQLNRPPHGGGHGTGPA